MVAGTIFTLVALFHLLRIFEDWPVIIGNWSVPKSVSWAALVIAGGSPFSGLGSHRIMNTENKGANAPGELDPFVLRTEVTYAELQTRYRQS
jgi:hypothetical protein